MRGNAPGSLRCAPRHAFLAATIEDQVVILDRKSRRRQRGEVARAGVDVEDPLAPRALEVVMV
jgi:hypothetical protein